MRCELCQLTDYNPRLLFEKINTNGDNHITAEELMHFLQDNYVKNPTIEECQSIIAEFDSSADGTMQYEEFLNAVLPATNQSMRDYCMYGRRIPHPRDKLPISVASLATRIFEREISMTIKRNESKNDLFKHVDHQKLKTFHEISNGQTFISMSDLIQFLELNGFYPRTEDLEAILRRCDHDADRALSYEEFCEVTELEKDDDGDQESIVHDSKTNNNSPQRKEIREDISKSQKKRRNSNDKLDAAPKENIEESWERKQAEERERQIIEERQRRYEATGKLVGYLQDKITEFVNLDLQKKLLSYHGSFNAGELFRDMDKDNHGYL